MNTGQTHYTTDYRMGWWFSIGWTVLLALTLCYAALQSDESIVEVWSAGRADGLAALAAGWVSAWGVSVLCGGSVRITRDRIYVRRFRDRLLGRTLEIQVDEITKVEEAYRAIVRSHVLRITTLAGRHIDIQYQMLRDSDALKAALLELGPIAKEQALSS